MKQLVLVIILVLILLSACTTPAKTNDLQPEETISDENEEQYQSEYTELDSSQFPVRQKYFEEVFRPKRNEYKLFEKTALFLNIPESQVPALLFGSLRVSRQTSNRRRKYEVSRQPGNGSRNNDLSVCRAFALRVRNTSTPCDSF